ncbi:unnamed protein product [Phaedon cochleariae]|uniref:CCHC-type domain-containing protein n=1 Tax=Phaedon cochleariae TaxID=80249 RepID=A0A9P0DCR5_PHACE|nr:unnamed protein product [Phaedon cochleariae]
MTRFARAKGSKASNERIPEEATSWTTMKQQLIEKNKDIEESKRRMEVIEKRNNNYKAFLQEKEDAESKKIEWANFTGVDNETSPEQLDKNYMNISRVTEMNQMSFVDDDDDDSFQALKLKVDKVLDNKNSKSQSESDSDNPPDERSAKKEIIMPLVKIKKKRKQKIKIENPDKLIISENENKSPLNTTGELNEPFSGKQNKKRKMKNSKDSAVDKRIKLDEPIEKQNTFQNKEDKTNKKKVDSTKKKKSGMLPKKALKENPTPQDLKKIEKKKQKRIRQLEKKKKLKSEQKQQKDLEESLKADNEKSSPIGDGGEDMVNNNSLKKENVKGKSPKPLIKNSNGTQKKQLKNRDKEEHPRKKPLLPHKMFINGQELEIDYVDGFPVKKEDALRLKKLRREMISKGLPRSEINQSLKLERRKAEKAFAREKKKVCFNCRTSGHNLSECPELGKNQVVQTAGSGICFKCGSTEHTHFECKVVKGQEFKFAQCFICQEQGHIARQCPDNARGLYPKGGACNVCGDVTHLKRDCPKYQAQQQHLENSLKVETVGFSNPDVLEINNENPQFSMNRKQNKIIKF